MVLTKTNTIVARTIRLATGAEYSHVSLSLDEGLSPMYSFARKYINFPFYGAMVTEEIGKGVYGKFPIVPCRIYRLPVTDVQYQGVKQMVETMWQNSDHYGYNYIGLIFNYFGRSRHYDNRFFCSEFVYQVLRQNDVIDFNKSPCMVRPQDFMNIDAEIIYEGNLNEFNNETILRSPLL